MIKRTWYVLQVKPRTEKKISALMRAYGYFAYFPTYTKVRKVQRRKVRTELPLFPGYVFSRLFAEERRKTFETNLLLKTITMTEPRKTIHQLRQIAHASRKGREMRQTNPFKVGDLVKVEYGPFRGVEGYVKRRGRGSYIVLNLEILNQAVEVAILPEDCKPADAEK